MANLKQIGVPFDRTFRNDINDNFVKLETAVEQSDVAISLSEKTSKAFFGDVKGELTKGYYNSQNGSFAEGINWWNYYINNGDQKIFTLEYESPITLRVVQFGSSGNRVASKLITNGEFSVVDSCVSFAINMRLTDSYPDATDITAFSGLDDLKKVIISSPSGISSKVNVTSQQVKDNLMEVPVAVPDSETWKLSSDKPTPGYYNRNTGSFAQGTNWFSLVVEASDVRTFRIDNDVEQGDMRVVQFRDGMYTSSRVITIGEPFTVPDNCTRFAVNIPLTGASPTSSLPYFTSVGNFKLYAYAPEYQNRPLVSQVRELRRYIQTGNSADNKLRILMVGNSFAQDACQWLFDICAESGIEAVVGTTVKGGESLGGYWNNVQNNNAAYTYYKWSPTQGQTTATSVTLDTALADEKWDVITFQQASGNAGNYSTFQPYLNNLIAHARSKVTSESLRIGLHMPWAYASGSNHADFPNYNSNQAQMYEAITDAYQRALIDTDIDLLIPSGTAVQNARTNANLMAVGDELTRDSYHMDYGTGRYLVGMTVFASVMAPKYGRNIFANRFVPGNGGTKSLSYLAKLAVNHAVQSPFKITEF